MTAPDGGRRVLRFNSVNDALGEAQRLVAADQQGRLGRVGNWTLGQTLGHLATWASFAFNGYPPEVCPPAPIRLVLRMLRNRVLTKGMPAGMKVGRVPGGTVGTEVVPTDEGMARFCAAMERLRQESPPIDNPVFGKLTHEQWIQLNLRHAELHLGFQVPREVG